MTKAFYMVPNDNEVHHYTDSGGLIGIVQKKKLWATNIQFLNDSLEYDYGLTSVSESLNKAVERVRESEDEETPFTSELAESVRFAIHILEGFGINSKASQFVAFFSRFRDDLGQWRGYAREGYCITFDWEKLTKSVEDMYGVDKAIISGPVVYGDGDEWGRADYIHLVLNRMHDILHNGDADLEAYGLRGSDPLFTDLIDRDDRHALAAVAGVAAVQQSIPFYKERGFADEQEVRVCVSHSGAAEFRPSRIGPTPYIELGFDPACIKSITVGPGLNIDLRQTTLEYLLTNEFGENHEIVVAKSDLSFRG
ncbi:hypothetical protein RhoFasGS6_02091 [Rhodococcus fascians]|uniref:DUF2971 domain-containing protein n=1 Tax=Rhodococcoides fascians TaxID=1828 RepID=UPI001427AEE8|nr:hypothetical protein [Rhodococcus fascians]